MRELPLFLFALSACTSEPQPLTTEALVGMWTGTASNGYTFHFQFTSSGDFTRSVVGSGGDFVIAQGTYSITDSGTLSLLGTFFDEEGIGHRARAEVPAYASASAMCDTA